MDEQACGEALGLSKDNEELLPTKTSSRTSQDNPQRNNITHTSQHFDVVKKTSTRSNLKKQNKTTAHSGSG